MDGGCPILVLPRVAQTQNTPLGAICLLGLSAYYIYAPQSFFPTKGLLVSIIELSFEKFWLFG